jgi:small subunit ribosomal protein S3Ae
MASQKAQDKWKSKKWFNVYAPKLFGEAIIGEVPAADDKKVLGRVINVSLSWITKNPQHSFMNVGLRINNADGNAAHTEIDVLANSYSYLHSLTRRYSTAIYTRSALKDRDGKGLVIKMLAITRDRIGERKQSVLRLELIRFVKEYLASMSTEELVKSVMDGKFQADGRNVINKIAVVNKLEVNKIEFSS